MRKLLKLLKYAKPYWAYAVANVVANILSILFSLVSFAFFIPVLNILFKINEPPESAVTINWSDLGTVKDFFYFELAQLIVSVGQMHALMYVALIIVVSFFFKNLTRYLGLYFLAPVRNGVVKDLRAAIYDKVLILPISFFTEKRKGDIIARMSNDVQEVEWSILSSIEMIFREPIAIIVYLATLFVLNAELTIFVLVLLPVSGILIGKISKSLRKTSAQGQDKMGEILSIIEETISGLRIIKAFNAIDFSSDNFKKFNNQHNKLMVKIYRKGDLASPLSEFMSVSIVVVILFYGGKLVLSPDSTMDAAQFIVYLMIVSQILTPAKGISKALYSIQKGAASIERIELILDADEKILEKPNAISKKEFKNSIEYKHVSFRYENEDVLKDINLKIPHGETYALVGSSGSGKTTMANLLPRFYDVNQGHIEIDGTPIKDLVISDVRGLMGIVTQDPILFNGTIKDNIAFGNDKATDEEIIDAAKVANAHQFILNLPKGYDTNIGDSGAKLSGGQRQRISIARAVLANPPILLLDEATSALDTESEKLVQEAINNLMKNRTSLVIAHRLSTIQHAEQIIVMSNGEIVERGTHTELLESKGTYKKLFDMQSFT
ncbi:MAG: ABC transporter ATP-binding protein [Bacteroidales bacterium]|nr:ABC transporter ATP-binding protein [Bacteroidales bacterium]